MRAVASSPGPARPARRRREQAPAQARGYRLAGTPLAERPVAWTPRRDAGLAAYERVLTRAGLGPVAGIDEAGRGACAGPLVVAAVVLHDGRGRAAGVPPPGSAGRTGAAWPEAGQSGAASTGSGPMTGTGRARWPDIRGLDDSKALTARARAVVYDRIVSTALAWSVVVIPPAEIDRLGLHVCNVTGMRRALARLPVDVGYVLTDGFEVPGLPAPALAMWKGDQVAGCVAAASIIAKVTRDTIMEAEDDRHPEYGFARHKGYSTASHLAALDAYGPSGLHRRSFQNVAVRLGREPDGHNLAAGRPADLDAGPDSPIVELTAVSLACARGKGVGPAARVPASSEGRT